ncbi:MAG: glycoside hydrolase family 3 C-terminal domain-containing protein [Oscillospiraceae bacterium]|nr:glycoside hydrolase family 3 C-terminal domain-containing protein [Oscillospiraceae bacterium]
MTFQQAAAYYATNPTNSALSDVTSQLLREMTVKEKLRLLSGRALMVTARNLFLYRRKYNATAYAAGGCKRLGIPALLFTDGPRGVVMRHSTCFPVSMLRGASFDPELESRIGEAIAKEAVAGGANYFAGVCINLLRHPAWGRAQETYGEDSYLLGRMGAALTRSVVKYGVMACPKHFACNSIEDLRFSVDVKIDERTLREVYLPHFQKCFDAGAISVMGAYNRLRGDFCCESRELLTDILRGEMGFDGVVISDFVYAIHDAAKALKAGCDVEMPYKFRNILLPGLLRKGKIFMADVDAAAGNMISSLLRSVPHIEPQSKDVIVSKEHVALAREAAQKGMVLLKNDGVLPIEEKSPRIAVIGRYADRKNLGDHGSSNVFSPYCVTPYKGVRAGFQGGEVVCYNGCDPVKAIKAVKDSDYIVVCVGSDHKQEGEFMINMGNRKKKPQGMGGDRVSLSIPPEDVALVKAMRETGKKVVVYVMGGSAYVMEDLLGANPGAILMGFYAGLEGGNALADILSGRVNPGGRLPFTIAKREEDYPPFRRVEDDSREIEYGYYHGYTLLDKEGKRARFPFGFGLSYTDFAFENLRAEPTAEGVLASLTVRNTGSRAGDAVAQFYIGSAGAGADRPVKQLKGFQRVELAAGESREISELLPWDDLRFYDPDKKQWTLDAEYVVYAGADAERSMEMSAKFTSNAGA